MCEVRTEDGGVSPDDGVRLIKSQVDLRDHHIIDALVEGATTEKQRRQLDDVKVIRWLGALCLVSGLAFATLDLVEFRGEQFPLGRFAQSIAMAIFGFLGATIGAP